MMLTRCLDLTPVTSYVVCRDLAVLSVYVLVFHYPAARGQYILFLIVVGFWHIFAKKKILGDMLRTNKI